MLLDWAGRPWHVKHTKHGTDTTARGTYTPSSGYSPGATIPGLHSTDTYRGVVDNTGQVTSPGNRDVCIVRSGSHVRLKLYLSAGGGGWYDYVHPDDIDRLLGPFRSLEEADGRIGHFNSGDGVYVVVGYRLYRLTAFTPGTTATHSYDWRQDSENDILIYYGAAQTDNALDTPAAGNREVEGSDSLLKWNTSPDESYLSTSGEDARLQGPTEMWPGRTPRSPAATSCSSLLSEYGEPPSRSAMRPMTPVLALPFSRWNQDPEMIRPEPSSVRATGAPAGF